MIDHIIVIAFDFCIDRLFKKKVNLIIYFAIYILYILITIIKYFLLLYLNLANYDFKNIIFTIYI